MTVLHKCNLVESETCHHCPFYYLAEYADDDPDFPIGTPDWRCLLEEDEQIAIDALPF